MVVATVFAESYLTDDFTSLLWISAAAAGVPLLVGLLRLRIAEVVFLIGAGVLIGPEALNAVDMTDAISLLSNLGLGFLFFFAGYELDRRVLSGVTGRLAGYGWVTSVVLAVLVAFLLHRAGVIVDFLGVSIALTSTALGTLLPVLRDSGRLDTPFGRSFMAAGAWGEFGPVIAISVLLGTRSSWLSFLVLLAFFAVAIVIAFLPSRFKTARVLEVIERGHHTSAQTAVRMVLLLLVALLAIASSFGLDLVLGAFAAGVIVRVYVPHGKKPIVEEKLEGIAFGFLIPLFFVVTGVKLDVRSIIENPGRLLLFFLLFALVRGLPQFFLYRGAIPEWRARAELSLYIATALPIVVAVTTVQVDAGVMRTANAAALVGAGALSVLLFPLAAGVIARRGRTASTGAGARSERSTGGDG